MIKFKLSQLKNSISWRMNALYWDWVQFRDKTYWKYYDKPLISFLSAWKRAPSLFLKVNLRLVFDKMRFKKVLCVYLLHSQHLDWIDEVIEENLKQGFKVYLFWHDKDFKPPVHKNLRTYCYQPVYDHKMQSVLPLFCSNLYLTPASTNCRSVPFHPVKVHFFHSFVSLFGTYDENSFAGYDYFFCVGPHHVAELKKWFANREHTTIGLIPGGYPKIDKMSKKLKNYVKKSAPGGRLNIVFAPTYLNDISKDKSCMIQSGESILETLLSSGAEVVFRPHPLNLQSTDPYFKVFEQLISKYSKKTNFRLDHSKSYFETYAQSDLMITDLSGTGFTYALGFQKPVVFFDNQSNHDSENVEISKRAEVGAVVKSTEELQDYLSHFKTDQGLEKAKRFKENFLFNPEKSVQYFMQNEHFLLRKKRNPNWEYF